MLDHTSPQRRYCLVMVNSYRELHTERRHELFGKLGDDGLRKAAYRGW
jgi:hypothetical protein